MKRRIFSLVVFVVAAQLVASLSFADDNGTRGGHGGTGSVAKVRSESDAAGGGEGSGHGGNG